MADIIAFRTSTPTIYIDGSHGRWWLNVRPCPPGIASLEQFASRQAAQRRAIALHEEFDWTIEQASSDDVDGAA